jgi:hypothetical protein
MPPWSRPSWRGAVRDLHPAPLQLIGACHLEGAMSSSVRSGVTTRTGGPASARPSRAAHRTSPASADTAGVPRSLRRLLLRAVWRLVRRLQAGALLGSLAPDRCLGAFHLDADDAGGSVAPGERLELGPVARRPGLAGVCRFLGDVNYLLALGWPERSFVVNGEVPDQLSES